MNQEFINMDNSDASFHKIADEIWALAEKTQQDSLSLLSLLRSLEEIHRKIRTEMFEPSLPKTRNDLYKLVKDIEEKGGWPYVERMKLKTLLQYLETEISGDNSGEIDS